MSPRTSRRSTTRSFVPSLDGTISRGPGDRLEVGRLQDRPHPDAARRREVQRRDGPRPRRWRPTTSLRFRDGTSANASFLAGMTAARPRTTQRLVITLAQPDPALPVYLSQNAGCVGSARNVRLARREDDPDRQRPLRPRCQGHRRRLQVRVRREPRLLGCGRRALRHDRDGVLRRPDRTDERGEGRPGRRGQPAEREPDRRGRGRGIHRGDVPSRAGLDSFSSTATARSTRRWATCACVRRSTTRSTARVC